MRYLWVKPAAALWLLLQAAPCVAADTPVDLQLALGIDVSRSVDEEEAMLQRQGYIDAFRHPRVIDAIRSGPLGRIAVSYYEWSGVGESYLVSNWVVIDSAKSAHAFADFLSRDPPVSGRRTGISSAIDYGSERFRGSGFASRRRVIDISGDGPNNMGELVTIARDRALAQGITINGLPIVNNKPGPSGRMPLKNLDLYYRDCVIGGPGAFYIVANDFRDFSRAILRKLILEIAGRIPDSSSLAEGTGRRPPPNPLLVPVADTRKAPPCDIGERLRRQWWDDSDDTWYPRRQLRQP